MVPEMKQGQSVQDSYVGLALEWVSAIQMFRKPGTQTDVNPSVMRVCATPAGDALSACRFNPQRRIPFCSCLDI